MGDTKFVKEGVAPNLGNFGRSKLAQILSSFVGLASKSILLILQNFWSFGAPNNIIIWQLAGRSDLNFGSQVVGGIFPNSLWVLLGFWWRAQDFFGGNS